MGSDVSDILAIPFVTGIPVLRLAGGRAIVNALESINVIKANWESISLVGPLTLHLLHLASSFLWKLCSGHYRGTSIDVRSEILQVKRRTL